MAEKLKSCLKSEKSVCSDVVQTFFFCIFVARKITSGVTLEDKYPNIT